MRSITLTVALAPEDRTPATIFNLGQAFYLAGNRCLLNIDVGPGVTQCLTSPGVVNLCMAIELFLKSLIVHSGQIPTKTHKLDELFALISSEANSEIEAAYRLRVQSPPFAELVAEIREFFVKVRYGYEFEIFAFQEYPVYFLAQAVYVYSAKTLGIKTGFDRVNV